MNYLFVGAGCLRKKWVGSGGRRAHSSVQTHGPRRQVGLRLMARPARFHPQTSLSLWVLARKMGLVTWWGRCGDEHAMWSPAPAPGESSAADTTVVTCPPAGDPSLSSQRPGSDSSF